MNLQHFIAGRSFVCRLKNVGAKTEPCGRPFFCLRHELTLSPIWTRNRWFLSRSYTVWTTQASIQSKSLARRPVSYAAVRSRKTAPVFNFAWKLFLMYIIRATTWSHVLLLWWNPACSAFSCDLTVLYWFTVVWSFQAGWNRHSTLTFCALHGTAPPYMTSQFTCVAGIWWRLRSASSNQLDVSSFCMPTLSSHTFLIAAAKVWNSLPDDVTFAPSLSTFQRHLKTFLFRCCYNTDWYCSYLLWL